MSNQPAVLNEIAIFQVNLSIWGGDSTLDEPDIKLGINGELPPKKLAKLGRKNIIDPKHLSAFTALRQQLRRYMESLCMRFLDGYAASLKDVDAITAYLEDTALKLDDLKRNLLANYDRWVDEWASKPENKGYENAIKSSKVPLKTVEKSLSLNFQAYQINPVNADHAKKLNGMANGLGQDLIDEIVLSANDFYDKYLRGKDSVKSTTIKTLQAIHAKAKSLAFLRSDIKYVISVLEDALAGYNNAPGTVTGTGFHKILSAVLILCSEDKILQKKISTNDETQTGLDTSVIQLNLPGDDELDEIFCNYMQDVSDNTRLARMGS